MKVIALLCNGRMQFIVIGVGEKTMAGEDDSMLSSFWIANKGKMYLATISHEKIPYINNGLIKYSEDLQVVCGLSSIWLPLLPRVSIPFSKLFMNTCWLVALPKRSPAVPSLVNLFISLGLVSPNNNFLTLLILILVKLLGLSLDFQYSISVVHITNQCGCLPI